MSGRHRRASKTQKMQTAVKAAVAGAAVAAPAMTGMIAPPGAAAATEPASTGAVPAVQDHVVRAVRITRPGMYAVAAGDTLAGIAGRFCGDAYDWTGIFAANERTIGADYDLIFPGQALEISCRQARVTPLLSAKRTSPARDPEPDGDGDEVRVSAAYHASPRHSSPRHFSYAAYRAPGGYGNVSPGSYSGMQQCIISRESGGQSQVMNASGHYGLYQFSASTWAGSGGNPADFGHASVAEQNRVFASAVRARGYSDWAPYDGC